MHFGNLSFSLFVRKYSNFYHFMDKRTHIAFLRGLGAKIRNQRFAIEITQVELAERVDCSVQSIGKIERGKSDPSFSMIIRIAKALLMSPKDLMPE